MATIVVFKVPSYFVGKRLLEYVEIKAASEWEISSENRINSFSGAFTVLSIFKKRRDDQGNKILVAEADTRHPGMIRIPQEDEKVMKKFEKILEDYPYPVLILNNWL